MSACCFVLAVTAALWMMMCWWVCTAAAVWCGRQVHTSEAAIVVHSTPGAWLDCPRSAWLVGKCSRPSSPALLVLGCSLLQQCYSRLCLQCDQLNMMHS